MAVTLAELCEAVKGSLEKAAGLQAAESFDELADGIPRANLPLLQVYPAAGTCDVSSATSERTTWGGVRQEGVTLYADLYAAQRSILAKDMAVTVELTNAIRECLSNEEAPFFGLPEVKGWRWRWERRVFRYANSLYMGARFFLDFRLA